MPTRSPQTSPKPARIGGWSNPTAPLLCLMLAIPLLFACAVTRPSAIGGGAIETTLCRVWGESLPTRSRHDTAQTQDEIGQAYADFAAACPDHRNLIP